MRRLDCSREWILCLKRDMLPTTTGPVLRLTDGLRTVGRDLERFGLPAAVAGPPLPEALPALGAAFVGAAFVTAICDDVLALRRASCSAARRSCIVVIRCMHRGTAGSTE